MSPFTVTSVVHDLTERKYPLYKSLTTLSPTVSDQFRLKEVRTMQIRHVSSSRTARRVLASVGIIGRAQQPRPVAPTTAATPEAGGAEDIGVTLITKDSNNPFFVTMQKGRQGSRRQERNVNLTIASGKQEGDDAGPDRRHRGRPSSAATRGSSSPRCRTGVNDAIKKARDAGLYVIALDTPPDPPDTVDITFATDNREAGKLIGEWAATTLDGGQATIALLDLFNDKVVSVDYNRDQGFLEGMGIDVADPKKNGDEAKTGKYTGGKGGDYDRLQRAEQRRRGRWPHGDGDLPDQERRHQRGLHDQRAGRGRRLPPRSRPRASPTPSSSRSTVAAPASSPSRTAPSVPPPSSTR